MRQEIDMNEPKKAPSTDSLEKILRETDEFLRDYDQKHGKPPPLTPEERERLDGEIRHYLRRGRHPE